MQRMRRRGSDLRITACRRQPELRQSRSFGRVDQVVGGARIVGIFLKHLIEDRDRFLWIGQWLAINAPSLAYEPTARFSSSARLLISAAAASPSMQYRRLPWLHVSMLNESSFVTGDPSSHLPRTDPSWKMNTEILCFRTA